MTVVPLLESASAGGQNDYPFLANVGILKDTGNHAIERASAMRSFLRLEMKLTTTTSSIRGHEIWRYSVQIRKTGVLSIYKAVVHLISGINQGGKLYSQPVIKICHIVRFCF